MKRARVEALSVNAMTLARKHFIDGINLHHNLLFIQVFSSR